VALDSTFQRLLAPGPQFVIVGDATAERDIRVGDQTRNLAHAQIFVGAFAILTGILAVFQPRTFPKACARNAI
jgi:hypothetical protein